MSDSELKEIIIQTTQEFQGKVEINRHLSYVAVGDLYIQGEDAENMIDEIEKLAVKMEITEEAAAIFLADNM
jgi:hypothetical protein